MRSRLLLLVIIVVDRSACFVGSVAPSGSPAARHHRQCRAVAAARRACWRRSRCNTLSTACAPRSRPEPRNCSVRHPLCSHHFGNGADMKIAQLLALMLTALAPHPGRACGIDSALPCRNKIHLDQADYFVTQGICATALSALFSRG